MEQVGIGWCVEHLYLTCRCDPRVYLQDWGFLLVGFAEIFPFHGRVHCYVITAHDQTGKQASSCL
ncbi:hypothetical protein D3C80_2075660 [compost metagenome]